MTKKTFPKTHLLMFVLVLSMMAACSSKSPSPNSTAAVPQPSQDEMRKAIIGAFKIQYDHPHRTQSAVSTADQDVLVTIEYIPPDRYSISSEANYYRQIIISTDKVYGKSNDQWSVLPMSPDQLINPNSLKELENSIQGIQFIGQETLDGKPTNVYQYKSDTTIGKNKVTQQSQLWIGVSDGLPYKIVIDGQIATMDARTGNIEGIKAKTTQTIVYDPTIKIEAPLP
jgi:hypothetical protein